MKTIPESGMVVAQFGATWCTPCKQVRPHVEAQAEAHKAAFVYLDIEEDANLAQKFSIRAMPTILALKDGQEIARIPGANVKQIESVLQGAFNP